MKAISVSLPDNRYGNKKPDEDVFIIGKNFFAVADGITRDPISPIDFGELSTDELLTNYPDPSPAKIAAEIFCRSFNVFVRDNPRNQNVARQAFLSANRQSAITEQKKKSQP